MTDHTRNLRNEAVDFLYKHGDLTFSAAYAAVDKLCGNGFYITRTPTPSPNAGSVKVKPLVWKPSGFEGNYKAGSLGLGYFVECAAGQFSCAVSDGRGSLFKVLYRGKNKEKAQAAAQADYAARILAAIEPTPDPRDAVIARLVEALEAAKTLHDQGLLFAATDLIDCVPRLRDAAIAAAKEVMG